MEPKHDIGRRAFVGLMLASVAACGGGNPKARTPATPSTPSTGISPKAAGDGVRDDTDALKRAIGSARALGLPLILRPKAHYLISERLDVSGVLVYGRGSTIVFSAAAKARAPGEIAAIWAVGAIHLEDLSIQIKPGFQTRTAGLSVKVDDSLPTVLRGIRVTGASEAGVRLNGEVPPTGQGARKVLEGIAVTGGRIGLQVSSLSDLHASQISCQSSGTNGVQLGLMSGASLTSTAVSNSGSHGVLVTYSRDVTVTGASVNDAGGGGIVFGGGSERLPPSNDITVDGCRVNSSGLSGIILDTTLEGGPGVPVPIDAVVQNCVVTGNAVNGITVTNSSGVRLAGNTCVGNRNGIAVASEDVHVKGNELHGNTRWGVAFFGLRGSRQPSLSTLGPNQYSGNGSGGVHVHQGVEVVRVQ